MSTAAILAAFETARQAILASEAEIEGLDRAIGDGDHYLNVRRGLDAVAAVAPDLAPLAPDAALKEIAMTLMKSVGGASGPLFASFVLAAAKTPGINDPLTPATVAALVSGGTAAVAARGKASRGDKTMLDVLVPLSEQLTADAALPPADIAANAVDTAKAGMEATRDITARFGRAAFLGERAIGHIDPGAMSAYVITRAIAARLTEETP